MRWILAGLMLAAVGCRSAEQVYQIEAVYQDQCQTGLGRGAEVVLHFVEDDAGVEHATFEIPELGLSVPCEDYDGSDQVCGRETEEGAAERWFWGREGGVLGVAVDRTEANGDFCITAFSARPWGHVEITEAELEQAAWVAAFLAAPPDVQLGAAAAVGWMLSQLDFSVIGDASN